MRVLRRAQRGVVLFIALVVLVAMSLAGIALLRGVDTGTVIASNLAFRQNTVHVSDLGVEAAIDWLQAQPIATLYSDIPGNAYYATWQENVDLVGNDPTKGDFDWTASSSSVTAAPYTPPDGYAIRFVVHRLCAGSGSPSDTQCIRVSGAAGTTASGTKGAAAYGAYAISVPGAAMYRITVRVTGPRNTTSYIQATAY